MAAIRNLDLVRGDTRNYQMHFYDDDNVDINITGWTVTMTVKADLDAAGDTSALIKKVVTVHSDPTHGRTVVTLETTDTNLVGDFYYDIQVKRPDNVTVTLMSGVITFVADVTRE